MSLLEPAQTNWGGGEDPCPPHLTTICSVGHLRERRAGEEEGEKGGHRQPRDRKASDLGTNGLNCSSQVYVKCTSRSDVLHTLRSGTDGGKSSPRAPRKCFIPPPGAGGGRPESKSGSPVWRTRKRPRPQPRRRRRLAARHVRRRRPFAARFRAQERLVDPGARATLGERARPAAQLRQLPVPSPVLAPPVGATYRPGSWQPPWPELRRSPGSRAALEQRREARAPYLPRLPGCLLIGETRSVSPETEPTSRPDSGSISETSGQA